MRPRDKQRSRVYAWERAAHADQLYRGTMELDEAEHYVNRIWRAERGRYGRAKVPPPTLRDGRGRRSAVAYSMSHALGLPRWARNPWVILHEIAHQLTPKDEGHGPRFVGVLIGLWSRHMGQDAEALALQAEQMGVKVHWRSIGAVPVITIPEKVFKLLPGTDMELAIELGVSYRVIRGAALHLIRQGRARWRGKRLVAI